MLTKSAQSSARHFLGARLIACHTGRLPSVNLKKAVGCGGRPRDEEKTEVEHEIDTLVVGVKTIEESDAVEVFAMERPPKTAMRQKRS